MSDHTHPRRSRRRLGRRQFQTAIRWRPDELEKLRNECPAGMTLSAFIRRRALDLVSPKAGEPEVTPQPRS